MTTHTTHTQKDGDRTAELTEKTPADFSGQLKSRLQEIVEAVNKSQKESLKHEIEIERVNDSDLVSISVRPLTNWYEEEQLGTERIHIILGPRGGVHYSVKSGIRIDDREYHNKNQAFKRTTRTLERLS